MSHLTHRRARRFFCALDLILLSDIPTGDSIARKSEVRQP